MGTRGESLKCSLMEGLVISVKEICNDNRDVR
jgi:hypothetical protein